MIGAVIEPVDGPILRTPGPMRAVEVFFYPRCDLGTVIPSRRGRTLRGYGREIWWVGKGLS